MCYLQIVVSLFVAVILDNLELEEDIKRLKQVAFTLSCQLIIDSVLGGCFVIAFCVRLSRGEMYSGHTRLRVCLSVCPSPHSHTTAGTRM